RGKGLRRQQGGRVPAVFIPSDQAPPVLMIATEPIAVITERVFPAPDTIAVVVLEVTCPGAGAIEINGIPGTPVQLEIGPQIVALGVTMNVGIENVIVGHRFGNGRRLLIRGPAPAPVAISVLFILDRWHGVASDSDVGGGIAHPHMKRRSS